jgi:glycogen debranching enzyme
MPYKLQALRDETNSLGKPEWRPMLAYAVDLHEKSIHAPLPPFPCEWEEIGPGYCNTPAFGHWDIVHQVFDVLPAEPEHAKCQLLNLLAFQEADGMLPGVISFQNNQLSITKSCSHPPVWIMAAQEYLRLHSMDILPGCYAALLKQIDWFEKNRSARPQGFYYLDILTKKWESGVDEGIRFFQTQSGPFACIDATAHVFALYGCAADWAGKLNLDASQFLEKAHLLKNFISAELYSEETGFFHDIWSVHNPSTRCMAYEGIWPLVVGAAAKEQARSVVENNLLNPDVFLARHPITTVAMRDPRFELRCWRGPAWNSMTFWAALGCIRYDFNHAAKQLLEMALDASALQFQRTGTIWEFYHPHGGAQQELQRKPHTRFNTPCRDYLGHNPLIAMARLYEKAKDS